MQLKQQKTNAVKFGDYGIVLNKEQLFYYVNGDLMRVKDVSHEFNFDDLYNLANSISEKRQLGTVYFVHRDDIVNVK
jgi:hypothetical protein